jgi:hypothetical protein
MTNALQQARYLDRLLKNYLNIGKRFIRLIAGNDDHWKVSQDSMLRALLRNLGH